MSSPCSRPDAEVTVNHATLQAALKWALPAGIFAACRCGVNVSWKARMLTYAAVLWAWSDETTLGKRFVTARKLVIKMFRWQAEPGGSYQGFIKALHKWKKKLFAVILPQLRNLMQQCGGEFWTVGGWVLFGVDGSRVQTPRTKANEKRFHPTKKKHKPKRARKGKAPQLTKKTVRRDKQEAKRKQEAKKKASKKQAAKKKASKKQSEKQSAGPQIWLTLLWHVGMGLPWAWKTGAVDSSERGDMLEMLDVLPEKSMITADAGFIGYDFWQAIKNADHAFVIRVGANVKLLKNLGYAREYSNRVYLWPDKARKQKQPPLVLRLITVTSGKHPMHMVTNVLSQKELSDRQAIEIYKARWGIEVYFRSLKQTFGRGKLRSDSPDNALLELDWSLIGLWVVNLLGVNELIKQGESPHRMSVSGVLDAVRTVIRNYKWRPDPGEDLWTLLGESLLDTYVRRGPKTSRNYPRKKQRKPPGNPTIQLSSPEQIACAKELKAIQQENQLSA